MTMHILIGPQRNDKQNFSNDYMQHDDYGGCGCVVNNDDGISFLSQGHSFVFILLM